MFRSRNARMEKNIQNRIKDYKYDLRMEKQVKKRNEFNKTQIQ